MHVKLICCILGAASASRYRYYGYRDNFDHQITRADCSGSEASLLECSYTTDSYCPSDRYDAGVICQSKIFRLT